MRAAVSAVYAEMERAVLDSLASFDVERASARWRAGNARQRSLEEIYAVSLIFDRERWIAEFKRVWGDVISPAILAAIRAVLDEIDPGTGAGLSVTDPAIAAFVRTESFVFAEGVTETVRKRLRKALETSLENGEGVLQMANRVETLFEEAKGPHSITIAATEVNSAQQWATFEGAARSVTVLARMGKRPKLMWITCRDERVRDSHAAVDAKTVEVGATFTVGSCQMRFPLDSEKCGVAREIVRCRCRVVVFVVKGVVAGAADLSSAAAQVSASLTAAGVN